jgi:hypothetical protein
MEQDARGWVVQQAFPVEDTVCGEKSRYDSYVRAHAAPWQVESDDNHAPRPGRQVPVLGVIRAQNDR